MAFMFSFLALLAQVKRLTSLNSFKNILMKITLAFICHFLLEQAQKTSAILSLGKLKKGEKAYSDLLMAESALFSLMTLICL